MFLTHWGQVTHKCVSNLTIIGSDNGLSPGHHQAIIWTNAGILLIGPLGINFSEILIEIYTFSLKKMHLKMSSGKWPPYCLGLNVLTWTCQWTTCQVASDLRRPGGHLNIKMSSYQYRDSHVKDKTVSSTVLSLTWEFPYLGKTVFILRRRSDTHKMLL